VRPTTGGLVPGLAALLTEPTAPMLGQYNTLDRTPIGKEADGIDLFREVIAGVEQTTIYQRYNEKSPEETGRIFARSVDPSSPTHDSTVQAWIDDSEDVADYRSQ